MSADYPPGRVSVSAMHGPRLRALIRRNKLEQKKLAKELGIDPSVFSRMLSGQQQLPIEVVQHVTRAAGITVGQFLDEEGYAIPGELVEALETATIKMRQLPIAPAPPRLRRLEWRPAPDDGVRAPLTFLGLPLVEQVADAPDPSGRPVEVPNRMVREGANAVVEVAGPQWRSSGILPGDHLYVRLLRGLQEADGQVVLCEVDGKEDIAILERLTASKVRLTSGQEGHPQIQLDVPSPRLKISGVVVGRLGNPPRW